MAKKIKAMVKLQCPAGAATPAPPVGTALGPHGVNIMEFVKQFNARTQSQSGMVIPCVVTIFADRTFTFITKTPPAPNLLLKEAGVEKGSGQPNRIKVGQGHPGPGQEDRRDQDGRSQRLRPRQRHADDRRHGPLDGAGGGGLMAVPGKKFRAAVAKVDRTREYPIPEAVALVKGAVLRQVRRDGGRRRQPGRRPAPCRPGGARDGRRCRMEPGSRFGCW